MSIIDKILNEALTEKTFDSEEDLVKAIRSVLRKSSLSSYKEKKSTGGYVEPSRHGYSYKSININGSLKITISFVGVSQTEINEVIAALAKANVNYKINNHLSAILISGDDNIKPDALLSDETKRELDMDLYCVLGTHVRNKSDITKAINSFNSTQRKIYDQLKKFDLVQWDYIKGENGRYAYTLSKKED
jgi:hypothetical protein